MDGDRCLFKDRCRSSSSDRLLARHDAHFPSAMTGDICLGTTGYARAEPGRSNSQAERRSKGGSRQAEEKIHVLGPERIRQSGSEYVAGHQAYQRSAVFGVAGQRSLGPKAAHLEDVRGLYRSQ
ncbi:unnamed protein product [Cuscuta europaea]|uniref:Uncharacterized protein n=1 Tax=Cuscuta europaea TaxID=41803 RepID=A0A9P1E1W7_CUSEU|nr:unnamed protein product [Cuscuta europaea]